MCCAHSQKRNDISGGGRCNRHSRALALTIFDHDALRSDPDRYVDVHRGFTGARWRCPDRVPRPRVRATKVSPLEALR